MCKNRKVRRDTIQCVATTTCAITQKILLPSFYETFFLLPGNTVHIIPNINKGRNETPSRAQSSYTLPPQIDFFIFIESISVQSSYKLVMKPLLALSFHCRLFLFLCMAWVGCGDLHDCVELICQRIWQNKLKLCRMWGLWSHGSTY